MNIKFSRHAKRRAKLYKIPEEIVNAILSEQAYSKGQHQLIYSVEDFIYPLKIIFTVEHDTLTIITVYPLKRGQ